MKIDQNVLAVLSEVSYPNMFQVRLEGQLDRSLYTKVNKVLEALGGEWSRKSRAHVFGSDARVRIDHAITVGEVETGQDVGWFPTPYALAEDLVRRAGVQPGDRVLEPSAGEGAIVLAIQDAGGTVTAVEHNQERRTYLLEHVLKSRDFLATAEDFMDYRIGHIDGTDQPNRFDRVVMNPPFCKVGNGDHLDHVEHAFMMLRPGGVLVSVLPSSITFRRDRRHAHFREWATDHGTIEPLPAGSFKESGTGVNTCVIRVEKR